jgi:hypothetical protein
MSATTTSPRGFTVILSVIGAFVGFAIVTALLQTGVGGKPADPTSAERLQKKETVASEQAALVEKYGLTANADTLFSKVSDQIKARKVSTSSAVVPGTPTALKQAAATAPAAPATPAPAATKPATPAPAVPTPPAEKPATPPPAPNVPAPATPAVPAPNTTTPVTPPPAAPVPPPAATPPTTPPPVPAPAAPPAPTTPPSVNPAPPAAQN